MEALSWIAFAVAVAALVVAIASFALSHRRGRPR